MGTFCPCVTIYVDAQAGNDANSGCTNVMPVRTIARGLELARRNCPAQPGARTTVFVQPGRYVEPPLTIPRNTRLVGADRESVDIRTARITMDQVSALASVTANFEGPDNGPRLIAQRLRPAEESLVEIDTANLVTSGGASSRTFADIGNLPNVIDRPVGTASLSAVRAWLREVGLEFILLPSPFSAPGQVGFAANAALPALPEEISAISVEGGSLTVNGLDVNISLPPHAQTPQSTVSLFNVREGQQGLTNIDASDVEFTVSTLTGGCAIAVVSGTLSNPESAVEISELGVELDAGAPTDFALVDVDGGGHAPDENGLPQVNFSGGSLFLENAGGAVVGSTNPTATGVTLNGFDLGETPRMSQFLETIDAYNVTNDESTLTTNGGICLNIRKIRRNYRVREDDYTLVFRNLEPITVRLPRRPCDGRILNLVRHRGGPRVLVVHRPPRRQANAPVTNHRHARNRQGNFPPPDETATDDDDDEDDDQPCVSSFELPHRVTLQFLDRKWYVTAQS